MQALLTASIELLVSASVLYFVAAFFAMVSRRHVSPGQLSFDFEVSVTATTADEPQAPAVEQTVVALVSEPLRVEFEPAKVADVVVPFKRPIKRTDDGLDGMNSRQLYKIAGELGVKRYKTLKKPALVAAIRAARLGRAA